MQFSGVGTLPKGGLFYPEGCSAGLELLACGDGSVGLRGRLRWPAGMDLSACGEGSVGLRGRLRWAAGMDAWANGEGSVGLLGWLC